jgi:hypothetical protein
MRLKLYSIVVLLLLHFTKASANDTIPGGSFIINMGVIPQTIGNGLKPYGLVYELLNSHRVPVYWVINPSKEKDGIDFSHEGIDYRGGTFIIPFQFRTAAVNATISNWQAQGVVGNTNSSMFIVNVTRKLYFAPRWTLDKTNGMIAANYFTNAGIPSLAYGGDSSAWKHPSELGACDDIYVMPHADPTWSTHQNLYYWNLNHKGNIWVGCHGASALEEVQSPDGSIKLNFLTTHGLNTAKVLKRASTPPFQYKDATNPVMQFMGILDGATMNGSERIYYPNKPGSWRTTTNASVYDTVDTFLPTYSNGPAATVAYGRAYGDENRGYVMYQGGHDLSESGTTAEKVAAQRAFFNYSLHVAAERYAGFDVSLNGLPEVILAGTPVTLSFTVPSYVNLNNYSVQWTSTGTGSFTAGSTPNTVIYQPAPGELGAVIITVSLTDACSRVVNTSRGTFLSTVLSNNGRPTYSMQRPVAGTSFKVLGNPVISDLAVQYSTQSAGKANVQLYDAQGRLVTQKNLVLSKGSSIIVVANNAMLKPGQYVLRFQTGDEIIARKILVN